MNRKFDTALDDCLNLLRTGASVTDCLARYPEHAEELRPLVSLASGVRAVPTPRPNPAAVQANRQRMLDAAQTAIVRRQQRGLTPFAWIFGPSGGSRGRPLFRATMTLAAVIVVVGLAAAALFATAADSLPGQALYPVKRFGENARLSLTLNPAARQELKSEYILERRQEVRQILDAGQQALLEFQGELEETEDGYWIVGGLTVTLSSDTAIEGHVTAGAMVIVQAASSGDGSLQALKLQVLTNPLLLTPVLTFTPTPTVTSAPSDTPTPTATLTPTPSTMPSPSPTVTPSPSATPSPTPSLTSSPSPMPTQTSTSVPAATWAPTHTAEPEPSDIPEDNETEEPEPTDDPDPTDTEEPDSDEEP